MNKKLLDLTEDLRVIGTSDDFWSRINRELAEYDVTSVFYGVASSLQEVKLNGHTKAAFWKTNHPDDYIDFLGKDDFLDNEITTAAMLHTPAAFAWHDPALWEMAAPEEKHQAEIERQMGLYVGISLPTTLYGATNIGGVGLSMGKLSEEGFARMWSDKGQDIIDVCGLLDLGMREQYLGDIIKLSCREKEALLWLCAGLRPARIAEKMNISEKKLEKYILSAKTKLKANTRDHAVAKALLLNLIAP